MEKLMEKLLSTYSFFLLFLSLLFLSLLFLFSSSTSYPLFLFPLFRCVLASLYEGLSVRPSVRPSVRASVGPSVGPSVCPVLFSNDENRPFRCSDDDEI